MQKFQMKMLFPVEMFAGSPLIIGDGDDKARIYSVITESRQATNGWETDLECMEVPFKIHKDVNHEVIYWLIANQEMVRSCSTWMDAIAKDIPEEILKHNKRFLLEMTY